MKSKLFLLLFLTVSIVSAHPLQEEDYCESNCSWEQRHVTSETIHVFPQCETVCGLVFLTGKSDVTEGQLMEVFKNMKHLVGNFMMFETELTKVTFLDSLETVKAEDKSITFLDNPNLTEISLPSLHSIIAIGLFAENNPKLKTLNLPKLKNMTLFHEKKTESDKKPAITITNSSKDYCISIEEMERFISIGVDVNNIEANYCEPPVFNDKICRQPNIKQKCVWIFGDVDIGPDSDSDVLDAMKTVEAIFGSLTINGTDLENLGFLENLKYVAPMNGDAEKPAILVVNNANLTDINVASLKYIQGNLPNTTIFANNNEQLLDNRHLCQAFSTHVNFMNQAFDGQSCYAYELEAFSRHYVVLESSKHRYMFICANAFLVCGIIVTVFAFYRKLCAKQNEYQGPVPAVES